MDPDYSKIYTQNMNRIQVASNGIIKEVSKVQLNIFWNPTLQNSYGEQPYLNLVKILWIRKYWPLL